LVVEAVYFCGIQNLILVCIAFFPDTLRFLSETSSSSSGAIKEASEAWLVPDGETLLMNLMV
jgi:hypothetical protein